MLKLSNASVTGAAKKRPDALGIVAMIYSKAAIFFGRLAAYGADATLLLKHFGVGTVFDSVHELGVVIRSVVFVFYGPTLACLAVAGLVFVAASNNPGYGAGFAVICLAIVIPLVGMEGLEEFGLLAPRAPFHTFRCLPARMRTIASLGIHYLAGFAVTRQTVSASFAGVESRSRFYGLALRTELFSHDDLLGKKSVCLKTLSLAIGV